MHTITALALIAIASAGRVPLTTQKDTSTSSSSSAAAVGTGADRLPSTVAAPATTTSTTPAGRVALTVAATTHTTTTSSTSKTSSSLTTSTKKSSSSSSSTTTTLVTTTTSSAPACSSTLAGYGCLPLTNQASFVSSMLSQHNLYRARHNAEPLVWDPSLVPAALANAQNNANNNEFEHTVSGIYGENIGYQYGYNNPQYLGFLWYDEVTLYNYSDPGFSDATGHFTQVVWLSTTALGCAYVQAQNDLSNNGYYYLSCEYSPPGNYIGQFEAEVEPPNSQPMPTQPHQWI